jgi:methyl-accepting chemotaxis protein
MTAMHRTEKTIEPVLASLQDNVLYLKHNLNSRAIASLKGEFATVDQDVSKLVTAMQQAIDESNEFIEELRGSAD